MLSPKLASEGSNGEPIATASSPSSAISHFLFRNYITAKLGLGLNYKSPSKG